MPRVRVAQRMVPVVPVRPALQLQQIVPVRPALPLQQIVPVRPALPLQQIVPVRLALPLQQRVTRPPTNPRPPVTPRPPVLQPPMFSNETDFIYEDEEQDNIGYYPTIVGNDYSRKVTQKISVRVPTFAPQQIYPRQILPRLSTQPIRYAQPKYSSHFYFYPNQ